MPATTQVFQIYDSISNPLPVLTFEVPTAEMENLQQAIRNGEWWNFPDNLQDQWHLTGIARYTVTAGTSGASSFTVRPAA